MTHDPTGVRGVPNLPYWGILTLRLQLPIGEGILWNLSVTLPERLRRVKAVVKRLGNLALLHERLNSKSANAGFDETDIELTKELTACSQWTSRGDRPPAPAGAARCEGLERQAPALARHKALQAGAGNQVAHGREREHPAVRCLQ